MLIKSPIELQSFKKEDEKQISLLEKPLNNTQMIEIYSNIEARNQRKVNPNNHQNISEKDRLNIPSPTLFYPKCLHCLGGFCVPFLICCTCCGCQCTCCRKEPPKCCGTFPIFLQPTASEGILETWGSYTKNLNSGLHLLNPFSQSVIEVNMKTQTLSYESSVMSKDNVQFNVSVVILYRVVNSFHLCYRLGRNEEQECVKEFSKAIVRNVVGESVLQNFITNLNEASNKVQIEVNNSISYWGLYIEKVCFKNIRLEKKLGEILSTIAKTKRFNEASIIEGRAQVECGLLAMQVSNLIDSPAAYQIRYLNTIEMILQSNKNVEIRIGTSLKLI